MIFNNGIENRRNTGKSNKSDSGEQIPSMLSLKGKNLFTTVFPLSKTTDVFLTNDELAIEGKVSESTPAVMRQRSSAR